ncbi:hypothetical protein ACHAQE_010937 [Botrytis cinerea]
MRILEVGTGTGSSTSVALKHLKFKLEEYTFTDLSPSSFEAAQARFPENKQLMKFKTLDINQSPTEQGFQENSYDIIIAAHVLQATKSVYEALKHCRQLLRPGGYLILLEPAVDDQVRVLRDPLKRAGGVVFIKKLLVIGGRSLTVSKICSNIKSLLEPFVEHIEMTDNLEDVQENGENLGNQLDAIMLSEMLLQMICLDMPSYNNILWGSEAEVAVEDGAILIPRVVRDNISNDSFNALRRNITRIASHITDSLVISKGEKGVIINEIKSNLEDPKIIVSSIQVFSSTLFSIFCSDDKMPFYLSIGNSINTGEMSLTISDKHCWYEKDTEDVAPTNIVGPKELVSFAFA